MCLFQVINAARTLAARPRSRAARENMDVFKTSWESQVHLIVDAVDEITGIDEFLAVSGQLLFDKYLFFMTCDGLFLHCLVSWFRELLHALDYLANKAPFTLDRGDVKPG